MALKICQDDKIQHQLAKENAQNQRELETFCEQFGLLSCSKRKPRSKPNFQPKQDKPRQPPKKLKQKTKPKPPPTRFSDKPIKCFKCGREGHISKYCGLKGKIKTLNLEHNIEEQINNLLAETSDEESKREISSSKEIEQPQDDVPSEEVTESSINVLTKDQDLLFEGIKATLKASSSKPKPLL